MNGAQYHRNPCSVEHLWPEKGKNMTFRRDMISSIFWMIWNGRGVCNGKTRSVYLCGMGNRKTAVLAFEKYLTVWEHIILVYSFCLVLMWVSWGKCSRDYRRVCGVSKSTWGFPVLTRGEMVAFFEAHAKIIWIGKTYHIGYLLDGQVRLRKQARGFL